MNLNERENKLELVIVAACQSEFVADIFIKKGAKYCTYVDKSAEVLDEVSIDFTQNLYEEVLKGTSVPKAFEIAR